MTMWGVYVRGIRMSRAGFVFAASSALRNCAVRLTVLETHEVPINQYARDFDISIKQPIHF